MANITNLEITVKTNSHIEDLNPMNYWNNIEWVPEKWIDHYDNTPRKIRCVSNGQQEKLYILNRPDNVHFIDDEDFLYYLGAALSEDWLWNREVYNCETGEDYLMKPSNLDGKPVLLQEGQIYTLKDARPDGDTDMGILWIEEIDNDYGFPAFLFEELKPLTARQRQQSMTKWEEKIDEMLDDEDVI